MAHVNRRSPSLLYLMNVRGLGDKKSREQSRQRRFGGKGDLGWRAAKTLGEPAKKNEPLARLARRGGFTRARSGAWYAPLMALEQDRTHGCGTRANERVRAWLERDGGRPRRWKNSVRAAKPQDHCWNFLLCLPTGVIVWIE